MRSLSKPSSRDSINAGSWSRHAASLFVLGCGLLVIGPAHAWVVEQKATVNFKDARNYAGIPYTEIPIPILDISPSIPYGGIVGNVGLYAGAGGHADLDLKLATWFDNSFDLASKAQQHTFIFSPESEPYVGDSFFLFNNIDSLGIQKLNLQSGNLFAQAGLDIDLGGWAKAKACLGICVSAGIKVKVNTFVELAEVSNSGLSVFGEKVDGTSPYSYTSPGGLVSATAQLPTFYKPYTNLAPGVGVNTGAMQQSLLSVNMDVAELIAKAFGFPLPLEGDLLGFGYEILSLDAFAGLDLKQAIKFNAPTLSTNYKFSSAVEVFDGTSWGLPITELTLAAGQGIELRSVAATSLGVTSYPILNYSISYDADLVLKAGLDLSALGLHGFGLSLGPLLDPDPWQVNLGSLDIDSGTETGKLAAKAGTMNLVFQPIKYGPIGEDGQPTEIFDLCSIPGGCSKTGYVTAIAAIGDPDLGLAEETVRRVFNFGTPDCNHLVIIGCDFDLSFVPIVTQRRGYEPDPQLPWFDDTDLLARLTELGFELPDFASPWFGDLGGDYARDFALLDEFLAAPPLPEGPASDDALMIAALEDLGVDMDNPFPDGPPLTGAPRESLNDLTESVSGRIAFGVPEPSVLALFAAALPAFGAWRRRRLRMEYPPRPRQPAHQGQRKP